MDANERISIEQVETLLKTQDPNAPAPELPSAAFSSGHSVSGIGLQSIPAGDFGIQNPTMGIVEETERWRYNGESPQAAIDNLGFPSDLNMGMGLDDSTFTWEMIGLGLEEPLPPQETIDELYMISPNSLRCMLTGN
jgi:hypothetical protein